MRRARKGTVEVNGHTFMFHRPTDIQMAEIGRVGTVNKHNVVRDHVFNWEGVKESDLFPGGRDEDVAFDVEAWAEMLSDNMTMWDPIYNAIMEAYVKHADARDDAVKK